MVINFIQETFGTYDVADAKLLLDTLDDLDTALMGLRLPPCFPL